MSSKIDPDAAIYAFQGRVIKARAPEDILKGHQKRSRWYQQRLMPFLPANRDAVIADIPCGDGNILFFLKEAGYGNVQGWDLDESRVEVAQSLGLPALVGNAFQVLEGLKPCDVIFSIDFLEHVSKEQAFQLLLTFRSKLKSGGKVIIRTPVTDSIFGTLHLYNDFTHQWATNSAVWRTLGGATGFSSVTIFDERPAGQNLKSLFRSSAFHLGRIVVSAIYLLLGRAKPRVWSPSAWMVLTA